MRSAIWFLPCHIRHMALFLHHLSSSALCMHTVVFATNVLFQSQTSSACSVIVINISGVLLHMSENVVTAEGCSDAECQCGGTRMLSVHVPASMAPQVAEVVDLRQPQECQCVHETGARVPPDALERQPHPYAWAHPPNCLHNLDVVVVWLMQKDWPTHSDCVVKYSSCEHHCKGHIVKVDVLHSVWHSFKDYLQHLQKKFQAADERADERDAAQAAEQHLRELQKNERLAIRQWASRQDLRLLEPWLAEYVRKCQRSQTQTLDTKDTHVHAKAVAYVRRHGFRFATPPSPSQKASRSGSSHAPSIWKRRRQLPKQKRPPPPPPQVHAQTADPSSRCHGAECTCEQPQL